MSVLLFFFRRLFLICLLCLPLVSHSRDLTKSDFDFGGHMQCDAVHWIGDKGDDFTSGLTLKDLSIFINGIYNSNFDYRIKFSLTNYKMKSNIAEAYIKYSDDFLNIKFGQFKPNFSLEEAILQNDRIFIDNALLKCNLEENFFGLVLNTSYNNYNIFISILAPEIHYKDKVKSSDIAMSFRGFKLYKIKNLHVHAGGSYSVFNRGENDLVSLKSSAFKDIATFASPYGLLVSHPSCLPKYNLFGFEFVSVYKLLHIQSELRLTRALWQDFDCEIYKSFYFQMACFLTGENCKYDFRSGTVVNPFPKSKFGSIEFGFRYSFIDISSKGPLLRGVSRPDGKKDAYNFVINWIVNNNVKFQLNYSREYYSYRINPNREISAVGLRTQFEF